MNFFTCINDALKTVHKNFQLPLIHFAYLFISFFGLFFILSIPLGILFVIFGIDLTDILKGSFIEIFLSSVHLMKKFLIFVIIFIVTLLVYVLLIVSLWIYIFGGTIGIMYQFLKENVTFNFKDFHQYGKKYFWKVAFFATFSFLIFICLTLIFGFVSEINSKIVNFLSSFSHSVSVFFNIFIYLSALLVGILAFLIWITFTLFGFFGIFVKNFTVKDTIKETKKLIVLYPQSIGRAALLFLTYILAGGVILSLSSLLAIIPHLGPILVAVYQFITQFANIYISMIVFAAFLSYYIRLVSHKDSEQEQAPPSEEVQQQHQNLPPSELS
ncbi:hypothetical protein TAGGR_1967 [Thermodesulfovibrio aggregans]|uniref:Glycerophosphoryl diester phosphodiesterase membrane domain-containing protein n=1 Tax=Thermodesulfovibrio aggregans TaxID=86166 RepID=A0A0U9HVQ3_9BACT|nr:hypothetical protein TAGGR_1967 [Thermodesulfovibrio aggregans]